MRALLIYPHFPRTFWSFDRMLELAGRKAMYPPLGLVTVAALLPQEWEFRLADRNVGPVTEGDWDWAEIVLISGMIVQRPDFLAVIREARGRGKKVAVGGPYATAFSEEVETAGADYLVLDEGEVTIPPFLEALEKGEASGVFRSDEKPDVTRTPIPRFDLLDLDAYSEMSVQFSRGCPFRCEFCDIIVLYGRRPRTKTSEQMLAELGALRQLGWNRSIFVVDDNFIGNKREAKKFLRELQPWMEEHGHPFRFSTEASLDLAKDQELMDLMTASNFGAVFLGIETPDEESLVATKKHQNLRGSLIDSVQKIAGSGLRVMAGFIIGFDGEKPGAGRRIVEFVEASAIPTALFAMLHALPDTALWKRLEREGRLLSASGADQATLMNFVPTRPMEEVAREYVEAFWELYDPRKFLDRTYRHYRVLAEAPVYKAPASGQRKARRSVGWRELGALASIAVRQGILRETRFAFWHHLWQLLRHSPGRVISYLTVCAQAEHFLEMRELVREQIEEQIATYLADRPAPLPARSVLAARATLPA